MYYIHNRQVSCYTVKMRAYKNKIREEAIQKPCDHPGCDGYGEYRAPKSRERLRDYHWFCLEHVKQYNKTWDYYAGMTTEQVERCVRFDAVWQKPSWPTSGGREKLLNDNVQNIFVDIFSSASWYEQPTKQTADPKEITALKVLGLLPPADFIQIKARYRKLVKIHHPDNNYGNKASEEKFKEIGLAYATLKRLHGSQ